MATIANAPAALTRSVAAVSWIVLLCFGIAGLEGYDIQAIGVAAPRGMAAGLHLNAQTTGWVLSASMVGLMIGAAVGGWIADRIGRKPVLLASVIAFGAFTLFTSQAWDLNSLLVSRVLTGLGLGGALPNLIAIAAEIAPPNRRTTVGTMMFCGMPAGGTAAAFVAGWMLSTAHDWRFIFLVGGAVPLALSPLIAWLLPETRPAQEADGDRNLVSVIFGAGRAGTSLLIWIGFCLTQLILYLLLLWLPTLAVAKGLTQAQAPLVSLSYNLSSIVGALAIGVVIDRVGQRIPMVLAYVGMVAVMFGLGAGHGYTPMMVLSGLAGFLVIGANYALYGLAPLYYPAAGRATGSGAAVAVGRLGSIAGPVLAGQLLAGGASASKVLATMVPVAVAAGVAVFLLSFARKAE